jgi:Sel1 repeat
LFQESFGFLKHYQPYRFTKRVIETQYKTQRSLTRNIYSRRHWAIPVLAALAVVTPGIATAQSAAPAAASTLSANDAFAKGFDAYKRNDFQHALVWLRQAADQGHAGAQGMLGVMYEEGEGVKRDYPQAVMWFRKSADQGVAAAQADLGMMYAYGLGVPRDISEAIEWEQKAAAQGYADAQRNLQLFQLIARGPSDDEIIQAVKVYLKNEALESIRAEYDGVETLSTNPLSVFQPKSKIATSISLACSLNAPNDRPACLEKMKRETLAERDEKVRDLQNTDLTAKFIYSVRDKKDYEGNYITFVDIRKHGTDKTFQWKLLLQFEKGVWVIAEKTEQQTR